MRKTRAPDLAGATIALVLDLIDGWTGKMAWDTPIAKVNEASGFEYSRFTFGDYPRIAGAFALKEGAFSGKHAMEPRTPKDCQIQAALDCAARFKEKADRLEREDNLLLE